MATKRLGTLEDRGPDPSIRQRMEDIRSKVDCTNVKDDTLEKIAVVELAIERIAQLHELDAIALDCWAYLSSEFGIGACFVIGDLIDRGLVVACETDIHAAITARMLYAATFDSSCPFIADMTVRHPTNDNGELLWHCGPFASSLKKEGVKGSLCDCKGFFEIKGGDITLARMDQTICCLRMKFGVLRVRRPTATMCGWKRTIGLHGKRNSCTALTSTIFVAFMGNWPLC